METVRTGPIEWAVAEHMRPGQSESGDHSLAMAIPGGAPVGVVDGLGHGAEAADAAKTAVGSIERHAQEPIIPPIRDCHRSLLGPRGALITAAPCTPAAETMTPAGHG